MPFYRVLRTLPVRDHSFIRLLALLDYNLNEKPNLCNYSRNESEAWTRPKIKMLAYCSPYLSSLILF